MSRLDAFHKAAENEEWVAKQQAEAAKKTEERAKEREAARGAIERAAEALRIGSYDPGYIGNKVKAQEPQFRMPVLGEKEKAPSAPGEMRFPLAAGTTAGSISAQRVGQLAQEPEWMLKKAQDAYDSYLNSEEYRSATKGKERASTYNAPVALGNDDGEKARMDALKKARELEGERDYWKRQKEQEDNRRIKEADVAEYEAMSEEEKYAMNVFNAVINQDNGMGFSLLPYGSDKHVTIFEADKITKPLEERYGRKRLRQISESLDWYRGEENARKIQEETKRIADEHPVLGSVAAPVANAFGGIPAVAGYAKEMIGRTGRYSTLNPYNRGTTLQQYGSGIVGEVAQNIEGEDPTLLRQLGSYAYQGGMEIARSSLGAALGGPAGSAALSAAGSLGSGISEASKQGATPGQAMLNASVGAAIEYITEKADMDRLFNIFGSGNPATIKGWLKNTAKQVGSEVAEEEISLLATTLAESTILGDKAGHKQRINDKIAGGMSYDEAVREADRELVREAWDTAVVTAFSAGIGAAGATIGGDIKGRLQGTPGGADVNVDTDVQGSPVDTAQAVPEAPQVADGGQMDIDAITDIFAKPAVQEDAGEPQWVRDMGKELAEKAGPLPDQRLPEDVQKFIDMTVPPVAENVEEARAGQEIEGTGLELEKDFQDYPYNKQTVIKGYEESVDQKVLDFVREVQSGQAWKGKKVEVGQVSDRMAEDIKRVAGVDGKAGNTIFLNTDGVKHIELRHGKNGEHDKTMANPEDIARINYVLENYEKCEKGDGNAYGYKNKDNSPSDTVLLSKKINGTYFVVEAVPDTSKTWIVSAYMDENGAPKVPDAQRNAGSPKGDAQNEPSSAPMEAETKLIGELPNTALIATSNNSTSNSNIQQQNGEVKGEFGGAEPSGRTFYDEDGDGAGFLPDVGDRKSKFGENTLKHANDPDLRKAGQEIRENASDLNRYQSQTEAGQNAAADERTSDPKKVMAERDYLVDKADWDATDVKTAMRVMDQLRKYGDGQGFTEMYNAIRSRETNAGQMIQALAEYSRNTPLGAAQDATAYLDELGERGIDPKYYKKEGYESWSKDVRDAIVDVSNRIDAIRDGDTAGMRNIVEELARLRNTTAWLGYSDKLTWGARKALNNLSYEAMREVAIKQMSMIPGDFRKRSKAEIMQTIRIQNMLASFKTINRNLQGNGIQGFVDAIADSYPGRLMDMALSKFTGVRTTGNDLVQVREGSKAARQAWEFATLCLELDIPTENVGAYDFGAKSRTGGGSTNTFSMQGGPVERFMAGFTQYMKYALDATDSVFSDGSKASTIASLEKLGAKSGLSGEEMEMLGQYSGQRRTYKEERKLTKLATGLKNAGNQIGVGGVGLGDMTMPFVGVPSNVAQTAIDYSGFGMVEGITEMVKVAKDAKNIDAMSQEQRSDLIRRQRKAASDFGRGMTGASLLALGIVASKLGCIQYQQPEDREQENAQLNRHMEGFQINWSAIGRVFQGESGQWQEGDIVSGLDSQSQFASLFSMADIWASEGGSFLEKAQDSAMAMYNNILEMPAMQGMKDLSDLLTSIGDVVDGDGDDRATAVGTMLGDMASGVYPAAVRNITQAVDPVIRDTSSASPVEAAVNRFKAGIPEVSKTLPAKIDPLTGQPQMRDESTGEAVWNRLFAPDAWHKLKENETASFLDELAEKTGETDFYPKGNAPGSFSYGGEKVTIDGKEDTEAYQQAYADNVTEAYGELIRDEGFQALTPQEQRERLKEAEQNAVKQAQAAIIGYRDFSQAGKDEMLRLQKESGDSSLLYTPPERRVEYTDKQGGSVRREMTEEEYRVYSDTERKEYDRILEGFTQLTEPGKQRYDKLTQEQQVAAAKYAKRYASEMAKRAALSDRYYDRNEWKDIDPQRAAKDIVEKVQTDSWNQACRDVFEGAKKGFDTKQATYDLAVAYNDYQQLPKDTREEILSQAEGDNKRYLLARQDGADSTTAVKVIKGVQGVDGDYNKYAQIAKLAGASGKTADALMKAYMPDYKKDAASPNMTELKYDAIREMGYSPADYVQFHEVQQGITGSGSKRRKIAAIREAAGCDQATATEIYNIYNYFKSSEHGKVRLGG